MNWLARVLRPSLGDTVLELGAGIGNVASHLMGRRLHYVVAEKDPLYLHSLRNRFLRTPNVAVLQLDPECPGDYERAGGPFDTVLCVNVLEYVDHPAVVIRSAAGVLKPGGSLIVLAPQSPALVRNSRPGFGTSPPVLQTQVRDAIRTERLFRPEHASTEQDWRRRLVAIRQSCCAENGSAK